MWPQDAPSRKRPSFLQGLLFRAGWVCYQTNDIRLAIYSSEKKTSQKNILIHHDCLHLVNFTPRNITQNPSSKRTKSAEVSSSSREEALRQRARWVAATACAIRMLTLSIFPAPWSFTGRPTDCFKDKKKRRCWKTMTWFSMWWLNDIFFWLELGLKTPKNCRDRALRPSKSSHVLRSMHTGRLHDCWLVTCCCLTRKAWSSAMKSYRPSGIWPILVVL